MKILHINSVDQRGAAIAAIRLHKALLEHSIDSSILFFRMESKNIPKSFAFTYERRKSQGFFIRQMVRFWGKIVHKFTYKYINSKKLKNKIEGFEVFTFNPSDFDITKLKVFQSADIIHLHWIAGFVDYSIFRKSNKNIVWTLHDMNPFTGGCHYSSGCIKYKSDCKNCPQLQGTINPDNAFLDQTYKIQHLGGTRITIIALSEWLKQCSLESKLFRNFEHILIPNSLDLSIFKPLDKSFCRSVLNLSQNKKILLFVSDNIENKRKGFELLLDAFSEIDNSDVRICAVGYRGINITYPNEITFLGSISDERLMALTYSAADAFILPSLEDNLPNVMLEAVSCGTPVIAFPVGGITDVIETGFNGILAKDVTSHSLACAINEFLEGKHKFESYEISKHASQKFSPTSQSERFLKLYKRILDTTPDIV